MPPRNRLTDQAKANVEAAKVAELKKTSEGWKVKLSGREKSIVLCDKDGDPVVYSSKIAAKRTLLRHNDSIKFAVKAEI